MDEEIAQPEPLDPDEDEDVIGEDADEKDDGEEDDDAEDATAAVEV